jgi:ABC-type bacteriocin/lantibiotic exporter with double-glycine peptidase domain
MAKSAGIKVVPQKKDYDCGIAAMAMLLEKTYGDVSIAVRALYGTTKPNKRGLMLYHMEEIAEELGAKLKRVRKAKNYLSGKTGILGMNGGTMSAAGHWVILKDGDTIIDPDEGLHGAVYKLYDYIEECKCRTATLLTLDDA